MASVRRHYEMGTRGDCVVGSDFHGLQGKRDLENSCDEAE
jgi:hypothetical protein